MVENPSLPDICMFWYEGVLSRFEKLSIQSYLKNGHQVKLFHYGEVIGVPDGAELIDANSVVPHEKFFVWEWGNIRSISPFTDLFRYEAFEKYPGIIWADTDTICIKPLAFNENDWVIAWQSENSLNGAILRIPLNSEPYKHLRRGALSVNRFMPWDSFNRKIRKIQRILRGNSNSRTYWGEYGPEGLTDAVKYFNLTDNVLPSEVLYPLRSVDWALLFDPGYGQQFFEDHPESLTIHMYNELISRAGTISKNDIFDENSLFEILWKKYM
ncbi:hypothetical protein [Actinomyces vulturis]|uniref:hypothetical protein n=1 Tax=Actinomyces vulturis TaxID=1857645 RepID=UPI00082F9110|nr:hypothetical protein [Actinomyces vulturis]